MGNLYFNAMKKNNFLPKGIAPAMNEKMADSLVEAYYNFTALDSTIADFRIKILKNDWPYIKPEMKKLRDQIIHRNDFVDSTAVKVIDGRITRERARLDIANFYLK